MTGARQALIEADVLASKDIRFPNGVGNDTVIEADGRQAAIKGGKRQLLHSPLTLTLSREGEREF